MDDKVRIFTRNPLIPLAVILFGSVWFALVSGSVPLMNLVFIRHIPQSILSFAVGLLIPWAILRMPPAAGRRRRDKPATAPSVAAVSEPLMEDQPIQHHVTFPDDVPENVRPRLRDPKRWSSPAAVPLDPGHSNYRKSTYVIALDSTTTLVEEPQPYRGSPELSKSEAADAASAAKGDNSLADSAVSCSRRSSLSSRKLPLAARFTGMRVFRSRSVKRGTRDSLEQSGSVASSCSSTPRSLTPPPSPPRKEDEPKSEKPESSSRGEAFRSAIAAPFKFKPKRASASATMSTAYTEKVSLYASTTTVEAPTAIITNTTRTTDSPTEEATQTPSPPPSPTDEPSNSAATPTPRARRKPFTAYLNLSLSTEVAATITSPSRRRASVSSSSTSNSGAGPSQPRIFSILSPSAAAAGFKSPKTPKTPVPVLRTQPYGAPYFAPMPTGEYAYDPRYRREYARRNSQRKVSGSASDVPRSGGVRRGSRDRDAETEGEVVVEGRGREREKERSPGTAKPVVSIESVPRAVSREPNAQVASRRRRGSGHRRHISDGVMTS